VIKVRHDLFQIAFAHLPVGHANAGFGNQLAQVCRGFFDAGHVIVQKVHLTATQDFPQNRFFHHGFVALAYKGLYRQRRAGGVAIMDRSRRWPMAIFKVRGNGRGGQVEHVDFGSQRL